MRAAVGQSEGTPGNGYRQERSDERPAGRRDVFLSDDRRRLPAMWTDRKSARRQRDQGLMGQAAMRHLGHDQTSAVDAHRVAYQRNLRRAVRDGDAGIADLNHCAAWRSQDNS